MRGGDGVPQPAAGADLGLHQGDSESLHPCRRHRRHRLPGVHHGIVPLQRAEEVTVIGRTRVAVVLVREMAMQTRRARYNIADLMKDLLIVAGNSQRGPERPAVHGHLA